MKRLVSITVFVLSVTFAWAQMSKEEMLKKNGEIYFQFEVTNKKDISWITKIISIANVSGNKVFAYASEKELNDFEATGIAYTILPHPNEGFAPVMKDYDDIKAVNAWDYYPTYTAYISMMYAFETNYPGLCDVFSIGTTVNGRQLLVAKISDNVATDEVEPEFFYTSTMHGDETTGYILMLRLIDSLLTAYSTAPRIQSLVNNIEIFINPLANPDGTYKTGNNSVSGAVRYNANDVDLNRNFPDIITGQYANTQPETFAFMTFAESRNFTMSANIHGGAEVCNYPWDRKAALCADDSWWQYVCHEYADTAQAFSPSGYMTYLNDGITNGFAWYMTEGCRQDYMNYYHQCREFTLEISNTKLPAASTLPLYWGYNKRSFLNYLEQCTYGVSGMVTDANTGQPVEAEVYVMNHEINGDSSWVYASPLGNYHRFLSQGTYSIRFSAPCYQTQTINNVSVSNLTATTLNVQLMPNSSEVNFTASATSITIGGTVTFTDQSCGNPYTWQWSITGPGTPVYVSGTSSTSQNPVVQFNTAGSYSVSLTATSAGGTFTQTKTNYISVTSCTVCSSGSNNGTEEWVSNVTFNTINNSSAVGSGYSNYLAISTNVTKGTAYTLSVTCGSTGTWTEQIWAFIDFNQDCDFTDTGESYDLGQTSGPATKTLSITIPAGATSGSTRMRISLKYSTDPTSCETFNYGEVEDYSLNIVNVGSPPVANFSANNTTPFIGQTVIFTDQSTNTPTSWVWSFNPSTVIYTGGSTSASQNPQVQFTAGGSYSVTLTATNAYGSDPEIKSGYINVIFAPVADFSANTITPSAGQTVTFTDLSLNAPSSWSWTFDPDYVTFTGGTSSASQNPQVQFTEGGYYTVTLIATNSSGSDSETRENYISVTAPPEADFLCSNLFPFTGESVNLYDLSTNLPDSWNWSFAPSTITFLGGTNAGTQNPQVQFDVPGFYTVQLTAGNIAGSDTEIKVDYIDVQTLDFSVNLKVMLEGPYNTLSMNTNLTGLDGFPLTQPYSGMPWNYSGSENVTSVPADVVDWVLVDMRDAIDASSATEATRITQRAAFLLSDGSVVGPDGISDLDFTSSIAHQLFVVVWHRNHLPVLSANALVKTAGVYYYDFTTSSGQAYGNDALKLLDTEIYGMTGGDSNADGIVNDLDKSVYWNTEAGNSGYLNSDLNMDGQSDNRDKNNYWLPNFGSGSQLP